MGQGYITYNMIQSFNQENVFYILHAVRYISTLQYLLFASKRIYHYKNIGPLKCPFPFTITPK